MFLLFLWFIFFPLRSFKENDSVVLMKELGQFALFENNQAGFSNFKEKAVILCLFLLFHFY